VTGFCLRTLQPAAATIPALAAAAFALGMAPAAAQGPGWSPAPTELNTLDELWDALEVCWTPPPRDQARPGTEITVRFSLNRAGSLIGEPRITYATPALPDAVKSAYRRSVFEALRRCTPLRLSGGLGGAIAGRPISARYVDDRED
jgi:hypothetical protein